MDRSEDITENERLVLAPEPAEAMRRLQEKVHSFWKDNHPQDVVKDISTLLREVEGAVCKKFESFPIEKQKTMNIGDLAETLEAISELRGGLKWMYRFPALIITVAIASFCIPVANSLDEVIIEHPILGGFPPAISAAAGCIGIQNTAIIIRALSVKLVQTNRLYVFLRYCIISSSLALGAAVIECFVAWVVVSIESKKLEEDKVTNAPFSAGMLFTDVPIVIFFAMFITGSLAGIIGAGVPLLVVKVSEMTKRSMDPAHWVGPIETVVQELCAAFLTFWIADTFVFP